MSTVAFRLIMAYPASLIAEANAAASVLDWDTGGGQTFDSERTVEVNGEPCVVADVPFFEFAPNEYPALRATGIQTFGDIVKRRNPAEWWAALQMLAAERGRELPLTMDDVTALCDGLLLDDEINEGNPHAADSHQAQ